MRETDHQARTIGAGKNLQILRDANEARVIIVFILKGFAGTGKTIVDGMEQEFTVGDVVTMQAGCRHIVFAVTELQLIEVQLGEDINVQDKQKFPLE